MELRCKPCACRGVTSSHVASCSWHLWGDHFGISAALGNLGGLRLCPTKGGSREYLSLHMPVPQCTEQADEAPKSCSSLHTTTLQHGFAPPPQPELPSSHSLLNSGKNQGDPAPVLQENWGSPTDYLRPHPGIEVNSAGVCDSMKGGTGERLSKREGPVPLGTSWVARSQYSPILQVGHT